MIDGAANHEMAAAFKSGRKQPSVPSMVEETAERRG